MSKIKLTGENSGYVEISAGQNAGNNTLETPTSGTRLVAHEGSQDVTLNANLTVNGVLTYDDVTNIDSVGVITARNGLNVIGGSVGIGTDNPGAALEVFGPTTSTMYIRGGGAGSDAARQATLGLYASGSKIYNLRADASDGSFRILDSSTERLRITATGNLDFKTADGVGINFRESGYINIDSDNDDSNRNFSFYDAKGTGSEKHLMIITDTGNIGVAGVTGTDYSLLDGIVINTANGSAGLLINSSSSSHNAYLGFSYGSGSGTSHADQYSAYIGRVGDNKLILGTNNTIRLNIDSSGRVGIQGDPTRALLEVRASGGSNTMLTALWGANEGTVTGALSDNTDKAVRMGIQHYDTDALPYAFLVGSSTSSANNLTFGGGTGLMNAATEIVFRTASNTTTTTGTERLRINSDGQLLHGATSNSAGYNLVTAGSGYRSILIGSISSSTAALILDGAANGDGTGSDYGSIEHNSGGEMRYKNRQNSGSGGAGHVFYTTSSDTVRLRIASNGTTTVGPQYDRVTIEPGNGTYDGEATTLSVDGRTNDGNRVALKVDRYDSGTSASTKFSVKYDGTIFTTSGMQAASVNLQSSSTSSWFQTGTSIASYPYVWAAKNSSSNTWHSGLQTDGDLYLGGNLAGTNNIGLIGSTGSGWFSGGLGIGGFHNANTIDEYEEGTWTPVMNKSGVTGTAGTPSTGVGYYRRIGQLLWISFYWYKGSGGFGNNSNEWYVSGIPFSLAHGTGSAYQSIPGGYNHMNGTNYANQSNRWQSNAVNGSQTLSMYGPNATTNWTSGYLEFSASGCLMLP